MNSPSRDSPAACDAVTFPDLSFDFLRDQTVGVDLPFASAFGERRLVYCDFTASGRSLYFIENYLQAVAQSYANTHTEDDITGRRMTALLHAAEQDIKQAVNAGPDGCVIAVGTGASGAIDKLQQILGIACPPATRLRLAQAWGEHGNAELNDWQRRHGPVVFTGPYEHHSNEVSWRQGIATVVEVGLTSDGAIDLGHLERLLGAPEYRGRLRAGSFSAASNVSGRLSPVRDIARLLHRHDALAFFDYAASAPYVNIDMNPPDDGRGDASIDALFISPHKFLGGPGSSGILVFNKCLYPGELPPTVAAGGTVDYVNEVEQDFIADIEQREKAGTPGVLQTLRAALAFQLKSVIGTARIEQREQELLARALSRWSCDSALHVLGDPDPELRIGIVSFNVRTPDGRHLHPKFVTTLLNDLFGIQSRAGCSCAGPYGHRLLGIDRVRSAAYRRAVQQGYGGVKPGWCRVGFHYTMDDAEADFVIDAVSFVARAGLRFLPLYRFDLRTGNWSHRQSPELDTTLSLQDALQAAAPMATAMPRDARRRYYAECLAAAEHTAAANPPQRCDVTLPGDLATLQFFPLPASTTN
ncbi:MAG: aminotransferase class V-fold PLP-dependent enzyme [Woeseia sp.]